jgi:DNA gyrase/topoisomerase IV subunit A
MKNEYSAFKQETIENDEERASLYKEIEEYKSREEQEKQSIEEYVSEIDALKAKINNLEHVITLKTNQIGDLKDEVGALKKELAQASKSKEQVIELLEEDQTQTLPSQEEMVSYLNEKQIFFVGGRWDMLDRLAEKGLFNATQMNKESQKFDKPKNPDIICYMTKFTNHPMYYHVKNNFPQDVAFSYNGTNLDKLIEELYSFGKLLDEREQSKEEALEG